MTGRRFIASAVRKCRSPPLSMKTLVKVIRCDLDTTYRFNSRIGEVANRFIQQNPGQLKKPLNSLTNGDKKAVTLLDESHLGRFAG